MINLSKRLNTIAVNIPKHSKFADIGSDHAYLPSYVCMQDATMYAIAGEVQQGPYLAAKKTIEKYGLQHQVEVRLGDGLDVIHESDQVNTIVIAGMGGKLITDILTKGHKKVASVDQLIIQPNTNAEYVRSFFLKNHFNLIKEEIVEDNQHIYEIMIAKRHAENNPYVTSVDIEKQLLFGPLLMQEKSAVFEKKWLREYQHTLAVMEQLEHAKLKDHATLLLLEKRKAWMEEILR